MAICRDPSLPRLAPREPEAHKGSFGTVLVVGGSRGMSGAAALAGKAALRGGAGLVRLAVAEPCLDSVAGHDICYMTAPLPADAAGRIDGTAADRIAELAKAATVIACGPGLGCSDGLTDLVCQLYEELPQPAVFDADALNALALRPEVLARHAGPRILTPHPGEFARLLGQKLEGSEAGQAALDLAARSDLVLVLKGHRTLVTDGERQWRNTTGNPGMATGGTGDVLTGLVAALCGQHLAPYEAARVGVYLHGLAGDLAAAELGQISLIASDLIRFLPKAFQCFSTASWPI